ncbi:uncharacterized protein [Dendrobates tinctorius]|uniref:uncharacterized protein n=1 Tax=Dendrobates tinctorius TaxID=92724 RepID=UPI003CC938CB
MAGFGEEHGESDPVYKTFDLSAELDLVQSVITDDLKSQTGDRGCSNGKEWMTESQIQSRNCGVSQRRKRTQYSQAQLDTLELFFNNNKYPTFLHREELAKSLGICESRVQVWFQNKRARANRLNAPSKWKPATLKKHIPDDKPLQRLNLLHHPKMVANQAGTLNSHFLPLPPSRRLHPYLCTAFQDQNRPSNDYWQNESYGTNQSTTT